MSDSILMVDEVAKELRVNARKIYQFIQSGELAATNIGVGER
jgi:excisionase family DNA binding protein